MTEEFNKIKTPIVIANWKMNLNLRERIDFIKKFRKNLKNTAGVEVVICPSFISLQEVGLLLKKTDIALGAQDVFWEEKGAYTGEESPVILKDIGCEYVIIGHSERRKYLGETDEMIYNKVKASLEEDLIPIICVGETFEERQEGQKDYVIVKQLMRALEGIKLVAGQKLIIAYEPVWVIGSGQAVQSGEVEQAYQVIHQTLIDLFPLEFVQKNLSVIYGGSVDSSNVKDFITQSKMNGVLVGGASLKLEEFVKIVNNVKSL